MEGSKAGRELPGIVDQVISLHCSRATPRRLRARREARTNAGWSAAPAIRFGLPAKDRSGRLDVTEPPDLGALLAKINTRQPSAATRSLKFSNGDYMYDLNDAQPQMPPSANSSQTAPSPR